MTTPPYGNRQQAEEAFIDPDTLRTTFALGMSAMYKNEVPLYGGLVKIVTKINQDKLSSVAEAERLTLERHGAIRLGKSEELQTVRRIFALLGMHPVDYYDLSVAGLPMHATCFRPIDATSLQRNPFRVFTTLLRPELLQSDAARDVALSLLSKRQIFHLELLDLLEVAESQGNRLTQFQAEVLIPHALRSFSWQSTAAAAHSQYCLLKGEHPILADIACFQSSHINHLTPRTLDIDQAQLAMSEAGMAVKSQIEGPPRRKCPILLRQTSFLALEENIRFPLIGEHGDAAREFVEGSHKARFGEIEERGAAVTARGRQLYDKLLKEATRTPGPVQDMGSIMRDVFRKYPDDWAELRKQGLVYCEYRWTGRRIALSAAGANGESSSLSYVERLVAGGILETVPITYEDFLPFSAAGIFQSNLASTDSGAGPHVKQSHHDIDGFQRALGSKVLSSDALYSAIQRESLRKCAVKLGVNIEDL